jgi:hypothetical protein
MSLLVAVLLLPFIRAIPHHELHQHQHHSAITRIHSKHGTKEFDTGKIRAKVEYSFRPKFRSPDYETIVDVLPVERTIANASAAFSLETDGSQWLPGHDNEQLKAALQQVRDTLGSQLSHRGFKSSVAKKHCGETVRAQQCFLSGKCTAPATPSLLSPWTNRCTHLMTDAVTKVANLTAWEHVQNYIRDNIFPNQGVVFELPSEIHAKKNNKTLDQLYAARSDDDADYDPVWTDHVVVVRSSTISPAGWLMSRVNVSEVLKSANQTQNATEREEKLAYLNDLWTKSASIERKTGCLALGDRDSHRAGGRAVAETTLDGLAFKGFFGVHVDLPPLRSLEAQHESLHGTNKTINGVTYYYWEMLNVWMVLSQQMKTAPLAFPQHQNPRTNPFDYTVMINRTTPAVYIGDMTQGDMVVFFTRYTPHLALAMVDRTLNMIDREKVTLNCRRTLEVRFWLLKKYPTDGSQPDIRYISSTSSPTRFPTASPTTAPTASPTAAPAALSFVSRLHKHHRKHQLEPDLLEKHSKHSHHHQRSHSHRGNFSDGAKITTLVTKLKLNIHVFQQHDVTYAYAQSWYTQVFPTKVDEEEGDNSTDLTAFVSDDVGNKAYPTIFLEFNPKDNSYNLLELLGQVLHPSRDDLGPVTDNFWSSARVAESNVGTLLNTLASGFWRGAIDNRTASIKWFDTWPKVDVGESAFMQNVTASLNATLQA